MLITTKGVALDLMIYKTIEVLSIYQPIYLFLDLSISPIYLRQWRIQGGRGDARPPPRKAEGGAGAPPPYASWKYYKIVKKWPENASKNLLPHPPSGRYSSPRAPPCTTL